jgi:ankyrin repeat protein
MLKRLFLCALASQQICAMKLRVDEDINDRPQKKARTESDSDYDLSKHSLQLMLGMEEEAARALLGACPGVHAIKDERVNLLEETILHQMVNKGNLRAIRILVRVLQARVSARTTLGFTPLHHAAAFFPEAIPLLIEGLEPLEDINALSPLGTALDIAVQKGHGQTASLLLSAGARVDGCIDIHERAERIPPLMQALRTVPHLVPDLITQWGAAINYHTILGVTPLMEASTHAPEHVPLLLEHQADLNWRDVSGDGALTRAILAGNTALVDAFLALEVIITRRDFEAAIAHIEIFEKLLSKTGTEMFEKTEAGMVTFHPRELLPVVCKEGSVELVNLMLDTFQYSLPEQEFARAMSQSGDEEKVGILKDYAEQRLRQVIALIPMNLKLDLTQKKEDLKVLIKAAGLKYKWEVSDITVYKDHVRVTVKMPADLYHYEFCDAIEKDHQHFRNLFKEQGKYFWNKSYVFKKGGSYVAFGTDEEFRIPLEERQRKAEELLAQHIAELRKYSPRK